MAILNKYLLKSLQLLIYLFPLSFIFGNMIMNFFVILISIIGIAYYNKDLLNWTDKKPLILISIFFFLLVTSTSLQIFLESNYDDSIKSLYFLRFLILLFVIKTMIVKNDLKLQYFFSVCLIISIFLSIDIIIQYLFNKNLVGFKPIEFKGYSENLKYHTGMFGEELIAGGYLQMFAMLGIFSIFNIFKSKQKILLYSVFFILIILFLVTLSLAGNRMPLILFIFFLFVSSLIIKLKNKRLYFFGTSILILLLFTLVSLKSDIFTKRFANFFGSIPSPVVIIKELKKDYPNLKKYESSGKPFHTLNEFETTLNYENYPFFSGHLSIYITSIDLFIDKPILGRGIKSFRNNCIKKIHLPNRVCESHPHNFTLEILNDTGAIGLIILIILVIYLLFFNYKDYRLGPLKRSQISDWFYLTIVMTIFIQFFPFKSSGSFFSTFNAAYTFLIIGISIGLNELRHKKTYKKR